MLRYLLLLAVVLKLAKVWHAHVKRGERHVSDLDGGGGEPKMSRREELSDCCCVS